MTAVSIDASTSAQSRKAVSAAVIGNVLEWYDFGVYAYVAAIIARKFFPGQDEVTGRCRCECHDARHVRMGASRTARPVRQLPADERGRRPAAGLGLRRPAE